MIFIKAGRRIPKPQPIQLFGEPIHWVETARFLVVTFDIRLTWSSYIDQVGKKAAQRLGVLGALVNSRSGPSIRNGVLLNKQLIRLLMDYHVEVCLSHPCMEPAGASLLVLSLATGTPRCLSNSQIQCSNQELWLKVSWSVEPHFSAARQIFTLTAGWPMWSNAQGRATVDVTSRDRPWNNTQVDTESRPTLFG